MTQRASNQENSLPTSNEQTLSERLRDCVKVTFSAGLHGVESDCRQAAEELDRQRAEIERLTRENEDFLDERQRRIHEILRLRAALEKIADFDCRSDEHVGDMKCWSCYARDALSSEPSPDETTARRMTRAEADAMNRAFWRSVEIIDDIDDREEVAPGDARYYRPSENPSICPYGQSDCETTRGGVCQCAMPAEQASDGRD